MPVGAATVLLVDPDPLTRDSLKKTLLQTGIGTVVEVNSLDQVRELADQRPGDLALVSLALGSAAGGVVVACCAPPAGPGSSRWPRPPTSAR